MRIVKFLLLATMIIGVTGLASAATWTLANSNGGDGYVVTTTNGFDLFGADNGFGNNYTTYTETIASPGNYSFLWSYITHDCCGSVWDPAGYVLNGSYTQLSTNCSVQFTCDTSGTLNLVLSAGDVFGFYVYSPDSILGRGEIDVPPVPEPGTLALLGTGLLAGVGVIRRKLML